MSNYPSFYNPERIGTLFYPDMAAIARSAQAAALTPAADDSTITHLVLIDMQIDFCHEQGALYVPGAQGDIRRTIEFIYRHAAEITHITCTLDSHVPSQIFHPAWWQDAQGAAPAPFTQVTADDVDEGAWQPRSMPETSRTYVHALEEQAKKVLTVWPYHVLIGGIGNALDPELFCAVMWHSLARQTTPTWIVKGTIPHSEHYSAVQPEVTVPDDPRADKNEAFLESIATADTVYIAGEAKSHCVLETVEDIVEEFAGEPDILDRIYLLHDCMSSVQHPEIDFDAIAEKQLAAFAARGLHLVTSANPSR